MRLRVLSLVVAGAAVLVAADGHAAADAPASAASTASAPAARSITLGYGQTATQEDEALSVRFVKVKDERCPKEVSCIWAGHAAVTLRVKQRGQTAETIVIGTAAPAGMNLPFEASVGAYRFTLIALEPGNSQEAPILAKRYRARIQVFAP